MGYLLVLHDVGCSLARAHQGYKGTNEADEGQDDEVDRADPQPFRVELDSLLGINDLFLDGLFSLSRLDSPSWLLRPVVVVMVVNMLHYWHLLWGL